MIIFGVIAVLGLADGVTFQSVASTAGELLPKLGKAAGVQMEAAGTTKNDVLIVCVKNKPLSVVMEKIAQVDHAVWSKRADGVWRLNRTQTEIRQMQREEATFRVGLLNAQLAKLDGKMDPPSQQDLDALAGRLVSLPPEKRSYGSRSIDGITSRIPLNRTLRQFMLVAPTEPLGLLQEGQAVLFSNAPKTIQHALTGKKVDQILAEFNTQQQRWRQSINKLANRQESVYYEDPLRLPDSTSDATRFVLKAFVTNNGAMLNYRLTLFDVQGHSIGSSSLVVRSDAETRLLDGQTQNITDSNEIVLSKDSQLVVEAIKSALSGSPLDKSQKSAVTDLMRNPAKQDPLSFGCSESLIGFANSKKEDLIGCLPDEALLLGLGFIANQKLTVKLVQSLFSVARVEVKSSDGIQSVTPIVPYSTLLRNANRDALSTYTRKMLQPNASQIATLADYAWQDQANGTGLLTMIYRLVLSKDATGTIDKNWRLLRLYGSLSAEQRAINSKESKILYRELTPAQKDLFDSISFFERPNTWSAEAGSIDSSEPSDFLSYPFQSDSTVEIVN